MVTSLGLDKQSSFENICNGKTGVDKISLFDASEFPVQIAAEVKGFDPSSIIEDGKEIKKMDRFVQLGLKAAGEAMDDAKFSDFDSDEFGVSSASGIGGLPNIEINANTCLQRGPRRISPFFIPSALVNMLGGFVSIYYKLKGPNLSSVTACAASAHAIMDAAGAAGIISKSLGASASVNVVRATFDAIGHLLDAKAVAAGRGKTLDELWG